MAGVASFRFDKGERPVEELRIECGLSRFIRTGHHTVRPTTALVSPRVRVHRRSVLGNRALMLPEWAMGISEGGG
jgi:hypothetical protein